MAFLAISYTTAAVIGGVGVALGAYLNGQSQEAEEQRNREMEGLRLNAECLTAQTVQLMEIVSQHQQAADVEELLIQRVEQLTGAIGQLQAVQNQLRATLAARNRDLLTVTRDREEIQRELVEALRVNAERSDAYDAVQVALQRAQEENRQLSATLGEVRQGRVETHEELTALREQNADLLAASTASRESCEALTRALTTATDAAKGLEVQIAQLREMNNCYDGEIERLSEAIDKIQRSRKDEARAHPKKAVSFDDEDPKLDDDPEFQTALAQSFEEINKNELREAVGASRLLQSPALDPELETAVQQMDDEELEKGIAASMQELGFREDSME